RVHRAGAAGRARRADRGSGPVGGDAARERARGGRGDRALHGPDHREPRGDEDQARTSDRADRGNARRARPPGTRLGPLTAGRRPADCGMKSDEQTGAGFHLVFGHLPSVAAPRTPDAAAVAERSRVAPGSGHPRSVAAPRTPDVAAVAERSRVALGSGHPRSVAAPRTPDVTAVAERSRVAPGSRHPRSVAAPRTPDVAAVAERCRGAPRSGHPPGAGARRAPALA